MNKILIHLAKSILIIISSILVLTSCLTESSNPLPSCTEDLIDPSAFSTSIHTANADEFDIPILSYDQLPSTLWQLADLEKKPNPQDSEGIELFLEKYYHPGRMASLMEWYLDSYFQTRDTNYLNWVIKYYNKTMEISKTVDNSLLFPFEFDWVYHVDNNNNCINVIKAPWYSAMTQGTLLMNVTRLFEFSKDSTYLMQAEKIFNGYYNIRGKSVPWITMLDENNFLWLEEYPCDGEPTHILNGFMYSIMGLYEYYKTTLDKKALFLLKASMTTIKHNISKYRNEGGISFYSFKFKESKAEYHSVHITLLRYLYHYSKDSFFNEMADLFYQDYHK